MYGAWVPVKGPTKAKRVIHFHGPWAAESAIAGEHALLVRAKANLERVAYVSADALVTLSEAFKQELVGRYRVPEEKVHVIPPGVDLEKFKANFDGPLRPTVVCVRRLEKRMGVDVLLRAWRDSQPEVSGAVLRIVGTGSEELMLKRLAVELGIAGSVEFLGRISDERLSRVYGDATFSVVPTIALEGFGLISLESLASGCPTIVTDCGGLPDAVRGLDPSLIVKAGSVQALAERISSALDGVLPSRQECRVHAELFRWDRVVQRHQQLYKLLLSA
jgi:glycosyltransferase involved in cell wall biosynthesis